MTIETRPTVEPKVKTVPEVLRHAARIIEERGHYKGSYADPDGSGVCAFGAINAAQTGDPWEPVPINDDQASIWLIGRVPGLSVIGWNDAPNRTAAEVIAVLRDAADAAERAA